MKLGFGLYRHMLNEDYYRFARQCGATHLVIHLVDYFGHAKNDKSRANQPIGKQEGWGRAGDGELWSLEELTHIKEEINTHGTGLQIDQFLIQLRLVYQSGSIPDIWCGRIIRMSSHFHACFLGYRNDIF